MNLKLSGFGLWSKLKPATKADLQRTEQNIMAKVSSLADTLGAIADQLAKAKTEIVAEIAALQTNLNDEDIPPAAQANIDRLTQLAGDLDALNPDAPKA